MEQRVCNENGCLLWQICFKIETDSPECKRKCQDIWIQRNLRMQMFDWLTKLGISGANTKPDQDEDRRQII